MRGHLLVGREGIRMASSTVRRRLPDWYSDHAPLTEPLKSTYYTILRCVSVEFQIVKEDSQVPFEKVLS